MEIRNNYYLMKLFVSFLRWIVINFFLHVLIQISRITIVIEWGIDENQNHMRLD